MKFLLALLAITLLAQQSQAQFGFRGIGLGIGGFGPFGGIGLRRFGFGPFGGLGFGLGGVPIPVPVPVPVPVLGKREIEAENIWEKDFNSSSILCRISSKQSNLVCRGLEQNIECEIAQNITSLGMAHRVDNLRIVQESVPVESALNGTVNQWNLVSAKSEDELNEWTLEHHKEKIELALYGSEEIRELGFRVKDAACWEKFEDAVESRPEQVRFTLFIEQQ